MTFKYQRGVHAKDQVTGYAGVITSRLDSLTGCNQYHLQGPIDKDGKRVDGLWVDEHALEIDTEKTQLVLGRTEDQPPG